MQALIFVKAPGGLYRQPGFGTSVGEGGRRKYKEILSTNFTVLLDFLSGGQDSMVPASGLGSADHSCLLNR